MSVPPSPTELVAISSPYIEPRIAFQAQVTRKVDNLTLIDGKTFLSTTVAGDVVPAGAPDVGFFHDDTRFLSHLELRIKGHPSIVLSSNTERSYVLQIELTTEQMKVRDSFEIAYPPLYGWSGEGQRPKGRVKTSPGSYLEVW